MQGCVSCDFTAFPPKASSPMAPRLSLPTRACGFRGEERLLAALLPSPALAAHSLTQLHFLDTRLTHPEPGVQSHTPRARAHVTHPTGSFLPKKRDQQRAWGSAPSLVEEGGFSSARGRQWG